MVFKMRTFLTDQQIRILRLRAKGLKQSEIAEVLGTSRANISILEKRALEKIEKARNTLLLWEQINSKVTIEVKKGEDIFKIPNEVFKKADKLGIKVPYTTAEIIAFLVENAPIVDRIAKEDFVLFLDNHDKLKISGYLLDEFDDIRKD
ncbi:Tfx family DNA-binding protein [Thermococcus sp. MV5]|uniref:Tfx family DNA-binding protein n=1 Tax=Thermococcus sp. MV5 TaxID=1638272 RepID=UPI001F0ED838|nr:Tfx family DNA-binding protein [Thermococcus sp. MV5]